MRPVAPLFHSKEEKSHLLSIANSRSLSRGIVQLAQIVLACAEGETNASIAKRLRLNSMAVGKWRKRYLEYGIEGLHDGLYLADRERTRMSGWPISTPRSKRGWQDVLNIMFISPQHTRCGSIRSSVGATSLPRRSFAGLLFRALKTSWPKSMPLWSDTMLTATHLCGSPPQSRSSQKPNGFAHIFQGQSTRCTHVLSQYIGLNINKVATISP